MNHKMYRTTNRCTNTIHFDIIIMITLLHNYKVCFVNNQSKVTNLHEIVFITFEQASVEKLTEYQIGPVNRFE